MIDILVIVPGPISLTAHSNNNLPSLLKTILTDAVPFPAPNTPTDIPYPISMPFSFKLPGTVGRFFHPIFSMP